MYYHYPMYYDPTIILVLIGAAISLIASLNVKGTFSKYSKVQTLKNMTAQDAALKILHDAGIYDVSVQRTTGKLTDHYSPSEKILRLSESVYGSTSIAAVGVAAHECGHAIQHKENYPALILRTAAVPVANFGSTISWPLIFLGLFLGYTSLARIGVFLFSFVVILQIITLPVEFNASSRAIKILNTNGLFSDNELSGAKKVLGAAALTYVAALFSSILQLLRLILLTNGNRRRD